MIRKQVYLKETQQAVIREIAEARGISEAEVIREAVESHRGGLSHRSPADPSAWSRALRLMRSLQPKKTAGKSRPRRKFNRAELYEGRLKRHERSTG